MYFVRIICIMTFLKLTTALIVFWNLYISHQTFLSQQVKRSVIITNKNASKYELTDEFPNDVRLKKISKLHGIIVQRPVSIQNENTANTSKKFVKTRN